jgi:sugar O-acyltransferase (sialic acid O-acetyltransferase NeuD family)
MSERRIAILGAGGHAKVVIATAEAAGYQIAGVFDDRQELWGHPVMGYAVSGPLEDALDCRCDAAVLAIGDNSTRRVLAERLHLVWLTVVHPSALVDSRVSLGEGTVVFTHSVIQPDTHVGRHVIINTAATIDHDCGIGDFAHIAPGVSIGGKVTVEAGSLVGIGAAVTPGVLIGAWAVVGAGAAVTRNVDPNTTVAGVPSRPLAR